MTLTQLATQLNVVPTPLRDSETRLLEESERGEIANCTGLKPIRAGLIQWLLCHPRARRRLPLQRLGIDDASVEGTLELIFVDSPIRICFNGCRLNKVFLSRSKLTWVDLSGCSLASLNANGTNIDGGLLLNTWEKNPNDKRAFTCKEVVDLQNVRIEQDMQITEGDLNGGINLEGAEIGGDFWIKGTHVGQRPQSSGAGSSIWADSLRVRNFFLLECTIEGGVKLVGSTIAGDLDCRASTVGAQEPDGLHANLSTIRGTVRLSNGFHVRGGARLKDCTVDGEVVCTAGCFEAGSGSVALDLRGIRVGRSVRLRHWRRDDGVLEENIPHQFSAEGEVLLSEARIGRDLDCRGGLFKSKSKCGYAMVVRSAEIEGALYLSDPDPDVPNDSRCASIEGKVSLLNCRTAMLLDGETSWKNTNVVELDGFRYDHLVTESGDRKWRREWLLKQPYAKRPGEPFTPQPHTQLAKVLRTAGQDGEARRILVRREMARGKFTAGLAPRVSFVLHGGFVGFGYLRSFPLIWLTVVIGLSALQFQRGWEEGQFVPAIPFIYNDFLEEPVPPSSRPLVPPIQGAELGDSASSHQPDQSKRRHGTPTWKSWSEREALGEYPQFNPLLYAIDATVPLVDLHQESYWLPRNRADGSWASQYLYLLWFDIVWGYLFSTLFVAGLAGVVRRE